ncbi:hypothetical protein HPB47_027357, partial [Ixodes persulcatus]
MTYDYKTASVGQSCYSTKLNTDVPGASSDHKVHSYEDDAAYIPGFRQPTQLQIVGRVSRAPARRGAQFVHFPENRREQRSTIQLFFERYGFPSVVGLINGTHIRIKNPGRPMQAFYICWKVFHALNVQEEKKILTLKIEENLTYPEARKRFSFLQGGTYAEAAARAAAPPLKATVGTQYSLRDLECSPSPPITSEASVGSQTSAGPPKVPRAKTVPHRPGPKPRVVLDATPTQSSAGPTPPLHSGRRRPWRCLPIRQNHLHLPRE